MAVASRLTAAMASATAASRATLSSPSMRRVQLAFLLGFVVDTALLVLLVVTAFKAAGPVGVAGIGVARMLTSMFFGALAAAPLARWRADRVLAGLAIARGLAALAAVVVIFVGAPPELLLAVAAATGATDAVLRPAQSTILPALAKTPEELVTANVASSTAEAAGSFAGPMIAAACIALGAPALTGLIVLIAQAVGIVALARIRFEDQAVERGPIRKASGGGFAIAAGFAAIRRRPAIGVVIVGFGLQTFVRGLLTTLIVVLSVELIGLGEAGVGLLSAAMGIGGIAGVVAGLALRRSSAIAFALALAGWGLPILVIGALPLSVVAVLAFAVTGLSNALLDIVGFTLLQRGCRNEERSAVFAIFESTTGLFATIGCVTAPLLINGFGVRAALLATGTLLPAAAVILWLVLRRTGEVEEVSGAAIDRLRRVPAFHVLPLTAIERLVSSAILVEFAAGDVLMTKGAPGDRFLVIDTGTVAVSDDGRILRELGAGAGIGEIALLRGGVRTATVTALTHVTAESFDAASFLAAVSGPAASAAASWVMEERLAHSAGAAD